MQERHYYNEHGRQSGRPFLKGETMNIYKELAAYVVAKYPETLNENYYDKVIDEYPFVSDELAAEIFGEILKQIP